MKLIRTLSVLPKLPTAIARLHELAYNLWWSWETQAQELYARLDPLLWEAVNHNPIKLLRQAQQEKLEAAAADPGYLQTYHSVLAAFDAYMAADAKTWFSSHYPEQQEQIIAYFSAEFGLHEALPIYSGGLGVLSGDHCKAASDMGLPFIAVGFLYPQGYFTQRIDRDGRQGTEYEKVDFTEAPATPAVDSQGNSVLISVEMPGRTVYAKVWRIQVGRVPIFLMDTDVEQNASKDRELSARLYFGDREMRISQEVMLGIGGVRAVRALGYRPAFWHINEGHSAFLGLERMREMVQNEGLTFDEAVEAVRANTLFTTHTPVPAGNDTFAFELIDKFFWDYWGKLGIDRERFIQFARQELPWGAQYSMTVLALRLSAYANGVSELHGHVSREMWQFLWPDVPVNQIPIGHITNGVHVKTWLAPELQALYDRHLTDGWRERVDEPEVWQAIEQIPPAELWEIHQARKAKLIDLARERVRRQLLRHSEGPQRLHEAGRLFDPQALTIGFARRFATYKRALLIFRDEERIKRLLHDPQRPVQIIFSGKAHPDDEPGKALIQQIYRLSQQPDFAGKIVFIEDYDMNIARHLIAGVDLWLNTPRRPREASGTSGQKAALSGAPSCSILDGWWAEGYDRENGWAIGDDCAQSADGLSNQSEAAQDDADAHSLYALLEEEIVPLFYSRNEAGLPVGWVQKMKNAIRGCAPRFNMRRVVAQYTQQYYLPGIEAGQRYQAEGFALARQMAAWKARVRQQWQGIHVEVEGDIEGELYVGEMLPLRARVWLNGLAATDVAVEIVYGRQGAKDEWMEARVAPMHSTGNEEGHGRLPLLYEGKLRLAGSGQLAIGVRVRPHHRALIHAEEIGLSKWA
jgi:starch phosphorylase